MNSILPLKSLPRKILLMFIACLPLVVHAQDENDIVNFLDAGPSDASKLMNAYLTPAIEGLSYSFNGGWYTTAKAHKTLGFDIGVSLNAVFIPSSKNHFNPADLKLEAVELESPASGQAPTIVGPEDPTVYRLKIQPTTTFQGPRGLDFKENIKFRGVVAPTAQIGIGIYKNTDLKIRWMPEVSAGSSKIKLFGIGVLHDIKQHIPGIRLLPFDLSVLVGYTSVKGSTGMEGRFAKPANDTRAQEMIYDMDAWLFQALISKKLAIVTFYGGIGFNTVKTTADVKGSYVYPNTLAVMKDPVSLTFKNKSPRVSAGMRLNLGPIYLNGEYTLQEYSTVSAGLGVTIR